MSQRYTAVFEWDGEVPAVGAGDGWLGGRLVRVSFEDEWTEPQNVTVTSNLPALEGIDFAAVIEEEHRYLSSALLSRCGPRAIGETWVDYARRCMGQS